MKNNNRLLFLVCSLLAVTGSVQADAFTITYKAQNKWAVTGDGTGFSSFLKAAKQKDSVSYTVTLPSHEDTSRDLSTERLKVLLSILEKSLGHGVLIEEKAGTTPANTLQFNVK